MRTESGSEAEVRRAPKGNVFKRIEGATDMLIVGIVIALGAAMLIGLITANGHVTW